MLAIILVWRFLRWFSSFKGFPDPWEGEIDSEELNSDSKPICLKCQRPVNNPSQYYCLNCGNVTGDYTRYMPFINIPFNYSIFGKIWKRLKNPETFILTKIMLFVLILITLSAMVLLFSFGI